MWTSIDQIVDFIHRWKYRRGFFWLYAKDDRVDRYTVADISSCLHNIDTARSRTIDRLEQSKKFRRSVCKLTSQFILFNIKTIEIYKTIYFTM